MDVTREDLREMRDELRLQIADGFSGVHGRLDALNGRVRKGEEAEARHDERIKVVEREMGWCRREFDRLRTVYDELKHALESGLEGLREQLTAGLDGLREQLPLRPSVAGGEDPDGVVTNRKVTQRDVWLVGLGIGLGMAIFKAILAAGPAIAAAVSK